MRWVPVDRVRDRGAVGVRDIEGRDRREIRMGRDAGGDDLVDGGLRGHHPKRKKTDTNAATPMNMSTIAATKTGVRMGWSASSAMALNGPLPR